MRNWTTITLALGLSALTGCAGFLTRNIGVSRGHLADCPTAPHCVSTQAADARHVVPPFELKSDDVSAWQQVVSTVQNTERTRVVLSDDHYLHAEVMSPWYIYTDDLELLLSADRKHLAVRSSSRISYYDFGANRQRVEALRSELTKADLLLPSAH